ncbi:unnamed protein product [marine sediment metagenome]|uniref:Uncharacterized protein n=1 Tax=marine sediment metagenome TaxID=412755 RepID=X1J5T8_9ZZZZ
MGINQSAALAAGDIWDLFNNWFVSLDTDVAYEDDNDVTTVTVFDITGEGILVAIWGHADQDVEFSIRRDGVQEVANQLCCKGAERYVIPLNLRFKTDVRLTQRLLLAGTGKFGAICLWK